MHVSIQFNQLRRKIKSTVFNQGSCKEKRKEKIEGRSYAKLWRCEYIVCYKVYVIENRRESILFFLLFAR